MKINRDDVDKVEAGMVLLNIYAQGTGKVDHYADPISIRLQ